MPGVLSRGEGYGGKRGSAPSAVIDIGSNSIRLVVYEDVASRWVTMYGQKYAASPILRAMRSELGAFRIRERERRSAYWLD